MVKQNAILFGPLPPPYGGVSVFMSLICNAVTERGGTVWSYKGPGSGSGVLLVDHRRFGHIRQLAREPRGSRISDSTHFHVEYPSVILLPLWLAAKSLFGFYWIKVIHDGTLPMRFAKFNWLQKKLFHLALGKVDEFVVASPELNDWLADVVRFTGRITTIPTLLPPKTKAGKPEVYLALEGLAAHERTVCSIGVFLPSYGFDKIANAVEIYRNETGEDVGLLLIDACFERDEGFKTQTLNGRDWVSVAENVPHENIADVLGRCDVFIRAVENESIGLSKIEALWCGVPVVSSNTGEKRGMLVYDFDDIDGICRHMRTVFNGGSAPDADKWAEYFRNKAERNFQDFVAVIMGNDA